jgi:cobalt-zinc-cadmium efflux system membrane fusion protein
MKKHFIQYLSYLLVAVLAACVQSSTQITEAEKLDSNVVALSVTLTETQVKNAGIVLGQVSTQPINQKIKVSGMLDVPPQNLNSISAPYGGFLKSTNLLQGMHVHKGDIVAVMEHPDYIQLQQDYLENKSQLTYLKTELERQQELAKEEINSKKTLQKAKAEYETMHARVQGLRAKLELIKVDVSKLEQGSIQKHIQSPGPLDHGQSPLESRQLAP